MSGKQYMERYDQVDLILKVSNACSVGVMQGYHPPARQRQQERRDSEARIKKLSVVEYAPNGVANDIRDIWSNVRTALDAAGK